MPKRMTKEEFIEKSNKVHGDAYDYSKVNYINNSTNVILFHKKCGRYFEQRPDKHLQSHGCFHCLGLKRSTTEEFIEKAKKIHGEDFDYSKVKYKNCMTNVSIFHKKCGKFFNQTPHSHLRGNGCCYCSGKMKSTTEEFVEKSKKIHGNEYDYSEVVYVDNQQKVKIKHNKCGKFFKQKPNHHLNGRGCSYCNGGMKYDVNVFIEKAKKIHGNEYDYSEVVYVYSQQKIKIKHNKCGKEFKQAPYNHLRNRGCPYCNQSKLEAVIKNYLTSRNIKFEYQKKYEKCCDKRTLPFDYYLTEFNVLIECQGKQHYLPVRNFRNKVFTKEESLNNFNDRIKKDMIKREYAEKNGYRLIEISYKDQKRISEILDYELNSLVQEKYVGNEQLELKLFENNSTEGRQNG